MDDGDVANSKDYTCQEFTLNSNNECKWSRLVCWMSTT